MKLLMGPPNIMRYLNIFAIYQKSFTLSDGYGKRTEKDGRSKCPPLAHEKRLDWIRINERPDISLFSGKNRIFRLLPIPRASQFRNVGRFSLGSQTPRNDSCFGKMLRDTGFQYVGRSLRVGGRGILVCVKISEPALNTKVYRMLKRISNIFLDSITSKKIVENI